MKRFYFLLMIACIALNAFSQKRYYEGGFFEKKGNKWYEYKDANPAKAVNWFTEQYADANFYVGDNGNCKIAIPKSTKNNFLLMYKNSDKWVFKYKSKQAPRLYSSSNSRNSSVNTYSGKIRKVSIFPRGDGMVVSASFDVRGLLGKTNSVSVYLYTKSGQIVEAGTSAYRATNNQFAHSRKYTPRYDNAVYNDFELYIPYLEMHKSKTSKSGIYKYRVVVWGNGKEIASHYSQPFVFTDLSQNCLFCAAQKGICRYCYGTGHFMGSTVFCNLCNGTGICGSCKGSGIFLSCRIGPADNTISTPQQIKPIPNIDINPSQNSNSGGVQYYQETCTFCKGTGVSPLCNWPPEYTSEVSTLYYCEHCKATKKFHTHGSCPSCQGKGYTQRMR